MERRRPSLSITLIAAVVATTLTAVPTTPAHALPYEMSTTGVRVVRVPGIAMGEALDINDHGAVVGSGRRFDGAGQAERAAFYWAGPGRGEAVQISPNYETGGVITDGAATALNDSSEVVGQHALPPSGVDGNRTFYWTPQAGRQTLAMPGTQPSFIRRQSATGIDSHREHRRPLLGAADVCSTAATTCAFRGPPDDLETLPAAGDGLANLAFDVSAGRIVGSGWTWTSTAGFTTLPGDFAWGAAINTAGAVAGQVRDPGTVRRNVGRRPGCGVLAIPDDGTDRAPQPPRRHRRRADGGDRPQHPRPGGRLGRDRHRRAARLRLGSRRGGAHRPWDTGRSEQPGDGDQQRRAHRGLGRRHERLAPSRHLGPVRHLRARPPAGHRSAAILRPHGRTRGDTHDRAGHLRPERGHVDGVVGTRQPRVRGHRPLHGVGGVPGRQPGRRRSGVDTVAGRPCRVLRRTGHGNAGRRSPEHRDPGRRDQTRDQRPACPRTHRRPDGTGRCAVQPDRLRDRSGW
jgi:hypothetical protein